MTLEQLKQYRAWRISLQSMRAELKQRHCELLQMENTGVLAQNEQARQRLYALEAQLAQSYLEKEAAIREVEQWIAQLPGFKEAIFRLRYLPHTDSSFPKRCAPPQIRSAHLRSCFLYPPEYLPV